ncbi:hypothetical protein WN944_013810 [Citrus x changshan-huyou]
MTAWWHDESLLIQPLYCFYGRLMIEVNLKLPYMFWGPRQTCTNMGSLVYRGFILLVCIGFLSLQPQNVSGLRSIDLVLRWDKEVLPAVRNTRILKAVPLKDLQMNPSLAPAPSLMFDPNQSNKRKVRKGSDPIHNRC